MLHATLSVMQNAARTSLEAAQRNPDFVDVTGLPNVVADIRYASTNNVLARDVYGGFQRILLHKLAAEKFRAASAVLAQRYPTLRFVVFDALRPHSAQIAFWDLVKGTAQQPYFADPAKGSAHSFGFALDLSLLDPRGAELDMGTPFDDLSPLAEPQKEGEHLASGKLTKTQVNNRLMLREVMTAAGWQQLPHEWWHYDALPAPEVRAKFRRLE